VIYALNSTVLLHSFTEPDLQLNLQLQILNNKALNEGVLYIDADSKITLKSMIIKGNSAKRAGSVLYLSDSEASFEDCEVINNSVPTGLGTFFVQSQSVFTCSNCVVNGNVAGDSSVLYAMNNLFG